MNTPFGGRQRGRNHELPLSEYPAWALEIMMGLYGPETIEGACIHDRAVTSLTSPSVGEGRKVVAPVPAAETPPAAPTGEPLSPIVVELEAINELVKYVERKLKRH